MVIKAMTPTLGALPDFIDDFNGIFGFMGNITDVMSTIFGVDTGNSSIDDVLNNIELLQQMQAQMNQMQNSIKEMENQQLISENIENQILALTTDLSASITTEFTKIEGILTTYLPAISNMLGNVYEQTSEINQKVDKLLAMMTFALKELDYIKDNVVLNSSIVEITPHVQKLVYVNKKFLSLTRAFLQNENLSIDSMQEIQEWAKSILSTEMNSFEFSVDTLHSIIVGDNLYKRSALKTFSDVLLDDANQYGDFGTPLAKFYTFFSSLATLQINGYLCLTFARKVLGLSQIDYQVTMQERIEQQNQMFVNIIQDKNYTNAIEIKGIYPLLNPWGDCKPSDLQAKDGYGLIGLEFFMDNGLYKAKAYQGKIDKNFSVHADTVEEIIIDDLTKLFPNNSNEINDLIAYPFSGELAGPPNTIITRIGLGTKYDKDREVKAFAYFDADFSPYDYKSGAISKEGTQTVSLEGNDYSNTDYNQWPMGLIGDLYMTPLKTLSLNVDVQSNIPMINTLNISGESYFSTILSREYNSNFVLFPYTNNSGLINENLIQNGDLEENDSYWKGSNQSYFVEGEGIHGSNALKVVAIGAFDQKVALEPNTTYRLSAFVKVADPNYSTGKIGIRDPRNEYYIEERFLNTEYNQIKLEFTTGHDTSNLSIFIQGGGDQKSIAWGDNFELYKIQQQENAIANFDFEFHDCYPWEPYGGGEIVEKEGMFDSKSLKITNSGGAKQEVRLKANTHYILTAYVKVNNTKAQIGCGSNQVTCDSTSYTSVKVKFKTGEDPSTTENTIYCLNLNDSGTVLADDFVLYEVPNLIVNGDFEQMDLSSWNLSPSDIGKIYLENGSGISNSNAIVLNQKGIASQKLPLKPYTKYRLTANIRVSGECTAWIGYGNGGDDDYCNSCNSKEFKQVSLDFTTGANPLQSDYAIYFSNPYNDYAVAFGDNFELYELEQIQ
ncbi:vegetative insecticidal protein Vip3A family protein (plasmid) [Bacillus mycoides]|nr:vegetative insecticidal protein Vip3A family protein [Bacillus mycoides]